MPPRDRRNAISLDSIDVLAARSSVALTDSELQEEKKRIRQHIDATRYIHRTHPILFPSLTRFSTEKLAPPLSETDLIQSLVW